MDRTRDYAVGSLELHLFFARIMKEHALFLKAGFLPPEQELAKESGRFLRSFEELLGRAIALSDCMIRQCVLDCGEIITPFTSRAECQTRRLTGIPIDRCLTARAEKLQGFGCGEEPEITDELVRAVDRLNRDAIRLTERLIAFKEGLLQRVTRCSVFTANYPLLIAHILREARHYLFRLRQLEGLDCRNQDCCGGEAFWNRIMMEHALFIRGLLDPCEEELICTAGEFAADYKRLLESARATDEKASCDALTLTRKFRTFKEAGAEGIQSCKIRSLILPLLADHVLREANHYLRELEER